MTNLGATIAFFKEELTKIRKELEKIRKTLEQMLPAKEKGVATCRKCGTPLELKSFLSGEEIAYCPKCGFQAEVGELGKETTE